MKPESRILDDLARMAGGAVNIVSGLSQQVREDLRSRADEMAVRLDLVPREDFERLEAMVLALNRRVEAIEKKKSATGKKRAS